MTYEMIQVLMGHMEYQDADEQTKARLDIQQDLIRDVQSTDHLIITTPIWHHFAPSYLVAWIQMVTKINPLLEG
jgi:FMN-dependent NADH-azoreductase